MAKAPRTSRIDLGVTAPPAALTAAVEEKEYFTARVPKSLVQRIKMQQAREGEKHGHVFFTRMVEFYMDAHEPK